MEIKIRKATLQDCEAMCKIHVSSIRELGRSHYTEDEISAWSRGRTPERYENNISERYVIIAEYRAIPVGFGTLDLKTGEIVQLYVSPECARKHVGSKIIEDLLGMARSKRIREVHLHSSLNAEAFYAKSGFQSGSKSRHRFPDGSEIDCIPMNKLLEKGNAEHSS